MMIDTAVPFGAKCAHAMYFVGDMVSVNGLFSSADVVDVGRNCSRRGRIQIGITLRTTCLLQGEPSLQAGRMQLLWLKMLDCRALGRLHAETPRHWWFGVFMSGVCWCAWRAGCNHLVIGVVGDRRSVEHVLAARLDPVAPPRPR